MHPREAPEVTVGAHDEDMTCVCVVEHRPPCLELNVHHVLPISLGGLDIPGNRVALCPTTHVNVHELLRHMHRHGPMTYRQAQDMQPRPVSRYAYDLALEGYRRYLAARPQGAS